MRLFYFDGTKIAKKTSKRRRKNEKVQSTKKESFGMGFEDASMRRLYCLLGNLMLKSREVSLGHL